MTVGALQWAVPPLTWHRIPIVTGIDLCLCRCSSFYIRITVFARNEVWPPYYVWTAVHEGSLCVGR